MTERFKRSPGWLAGVSLYLCLFAWLAHAQTEPMAAPENAPRPKPDKQVIENVKFPGLTLDAGRLRVDVDAKIALDKGMLEVVACTPDSREHESIVVVDAAPMHIHAALLLLGAQNGHPAMVKPANEEQTRFVHLPPRGDAIEVSLVYKDADGKSIERPISDFIQREPQADAPDAPADADDAGAGEHTDPNEASQDQGQTPAPKPPGPEAVFAHFLFAGSRVVTDKDGKRHYLADQSGNVVSISTFGDAVLCMPTIQSRANHELAWQINPEHLPKVGTAVKLRLTIQDRKQEQDASGDTQ